MRAGQGGGGAWIHCHAAGGREGKELLLWDEGRGSRVGRHHQHHRRRRRRLHHHSGFFLPFTNGRCMHYITLRLEEDERRREGLTNQEYHLLPAKRIELNQSSHRLTPFSHPNRELKLQIFNGLGRNMGTQQSRGSLRLSDFLRQSPLTVRLAEIGRGGRDGGMPLCRVSHDGLLG